MYAVETYFIAPTNARGARIKARVMEGTRKGAPARAVSLPWSHALGVKGNHQWAAETLLTRLGWAGEWVDGAGHNGSTVWVQAALPGGLRLSPSVVIAERAGEGP